MSTLTVLVGNPQPGSRTSQVAEGLASRISALIGAELLPTIELADVAGELFDWESTTVGALNEQLAASDYAVIATPTYKASYTGLLKAFLDRYPTNGLAGLTAVPVFTIGSDAHTLAVEFTLRPLLVELGASVPTRGLSFAVSKFDDRDTILDEWIADQGRYLTR